MFYAIPLENKPTWRNPPWLTIVIIVVNMVIFWGPQQSEESARERAARYYLASELPRWEFPTFVQHLEQIQHPHAGQARRLLSHLRDQDARGAQLLSLMDRVPTFVQMVHEDKVIRPDDVRYTTWKSLRTRYESMLPAPFTQRWSMSHEKDAPLEPWTWLSAAFLHGSTGHLLGNMLFLFLFGFTVELSLGRPTFLAFYLLGAFGASAMAVWAYSGKGGYGLGASGAIAALMAMYALIYRLRRIRFFYQFFFYFNYVTAPALILLPIWIANELAQHFYGPSGVGYMAHLGGLLTGAALMMLWPAARTSQPAAKTEVAAPDPFYGHVERATQLGKQMKFEEACTEWQSAAALRPQDMPTLQAFFNVAKLWPSRTAFHHAAQRVFRLRDGGEHTIAFQHEVYGIYLEKARPSIQIGPAQMGRLASRFARAGYFEDARRLCQALQASAPEHAGTVDAITACAASLWHKGQREHALALLPSLQKLAPAHAVTHMLAQG